LSLKVEFLIERLALLRLPLVLGAVEDLVGVHERVDEGQQLSIAHQAHGVVEALLAAEVTAALAALLRMHLHREVARRGHGSVNFFTNFIRLLFPAHHEDEIDECTHPGAGYKQVFPLFVPGGTAVVQEVYEIYHRACRGDNLCVGFSICPCLVDGHGRGDGRVVGLVVHVAVAEDVDVREVLRLEGGLREGLEDPLLEVDGGGDAGHQELEEGLLAQHGHPQGHSCASFFEVHRFR